MSTLHSYISDYCLLFPCSYYIKKNLVIMNNELLVKNIIHFSVLNKEYPTRACEAAGVGKNLISDLRRGRAPSFEKIQMLAEYFGITTSELLGENKKPPTSEDEERLKEVLANADDETREIMGLLDQLNPGNLERAKEYIRFELARQGGAGDKQQ